MCSCDCGDDCRELEIIGLLEKLLVKLDANQSDLIATKGTYCAWCDTKTGVNPLTEKYERMDKRIDPLCAKLREDNAMLTKYLTEQGAVTNG